MKRKLLSILLTLCLAFSLLPTAALADGEGTLAPAATALPEAVEGVITLESKTYKLSENLTVTATIVVPSGVTATLDLGGKTLKRDSDTVLDIYGELTIKNGRIEKGAGGNAVAIWLNNAAKLTVESDAVVSVSENAEADCYCIAMWKDCTAANLTVKGTLKGGSGLTVNGLIVNTGNTVTIDGATIEAVNFGIYQAGVSETVIKDSNIKGSTAIEVRAGSMTIESGTFTATATEYKCDPNGNGPTTEGAALAIAQHTTKKDISVTINGGTFTGIKALNESNPQNNAPTPQVTLNVKNGTFNGDVTITDGDQTSITGGTFSSDVSAYVPNGYIQNENGAVETLGETNAVAKVGDTYYKTLAAAVTAAKDGNTVKILRDVNTAERHDVVGKKLILDLNGQTITTTIAERFMNIRGGGKLTVTDNSASKDGKIISPTGDYIFVVFKGELDFQAGTVDARGYWQYDNNGTTEYYGNTIVLVYGDTNDTENYATVTLGENANLIATTKAVDEMPVGEAYAIMVDKNRAESAYGVKVDIKGTTEHAGLYVNGVVKKTEGNVPVFNIYDGAVVDGQIYSAGYAKWNIYGGKITGSTGMEIRAGELNMTGGSLTGTATPTTVTPNGNGGTSDGAGLAIAQHTTKLPVIVNISDGTISGYSALYESNPQNNDSNSIAKVQIAVTGGNFAAINGGTNAVYSQDKTGFITGGYFTSKPAKEYIATGYHVVESDKDGYSCMISNTVPTKAQVIVNDTTAVTPPTNAHLTEADKTAIRTKTNVDGVAEAAAGSKNRIVKDAGVNASAVDASKLIEVEVAVDVAVSDVQKNAEGTAISTITFTAKPTATVKVDGTATDTTVPVTNDMLNGKPITVKLPLPAGFTPEQIKHISSDRSVEYFLRTAKSGAKTFEIKDGCAVFTITKFSTFELSGTVTYVEPSYSSGSSSDPTYSVTVDKTKNGSVTVSPKSASKGDTVTVTVKPDSGYVLETLTVTDKNGNELTLKDKGNGKYTFTMPAGKVEVKATFMEDNSVLNFFYDVPNNAYFYEAVKWAVENGITTGVGNDLFAPEQPCTRAQIVTFLWRAAGSPEPKGAASGMTDVVSGSYYEKAVAWAIENGITTGTTTSTFSPDATCTRAQAVTFLARALNAKAASAAEFSDVPTGSYFADAVAWAAANGVTEGIGGGLFGSDNDCTRGQIVTFLYRAYNK